MSTVQVHDDRQGAGLHRVDEVRAGERGGGERNQGGRLARLSFHWQCPQFMCTSIILICNGNFISTFNDIPI